MHHKNLPFLSVYIPLRDTYIRLRKISNLAVYKYTHIYTQIFVISSNAKNVYIKKRKYTAEIFVGTSFIYIHNALYIHYYRNSRMADSSRFFHFHIRPIHTRIYIYIYRVRDDRPVSRAAFFDLRDCVTLDMLQLSDTTYIVYNIYTV